MKHILMCPPGNFKVEYEINPHMVGHIGSTDKFRVAQQWSELRNTLMSVGARVTCSPEPPENCPDAVFMANAGLLYQDLFIPSYFKHPERQVEEPYFRDWFIKTLNFFEPPYKEPSPSRLSFEGAGDALFSHDRKNLWLGFGFRTSGDFKFVLDEHFGTFDDVIVRPLQLVDPRWYHLDTCFCPLDTGELLWYPEAFSEDAQMTIDSWYGSKSIVVNQEDALAFACNSVSVGRSLVTPLISDELLGTLTQRGYNVHQVEMSQFLRSGGACKCLTLEVVE